jgi:hypothetical protein
MLCTIALETKLPRIAPGGTISAGYPSIVPIFDMPCVPRIGEEIFITSESGANRHTVTSVRYVVDAKGAAGGVIVLVTEGVAIT